MNPQLIGIVWGLPQVKHQPFAQMWAQTETKVRYNPRTPSRASCN